MMTIYELRLETWDEHWEVKKTFFFQDQELVGGDWNMAGL